MSQDGTQFPTSGKDELLQTISAIDSKGEDDEAVVVRIEPWQWRCVKTVKAKHGGSKTKIMKAAVIVGLKRIRNKVGGDILEEFEQLEMLFMDLDGKVSRQPVTRHDLRRGTESNKINTDYAIGGGFEETVSTNIPVSIKAEVFDSFTEVVGLSISDMVRICAAAAFSECDLINSRERPRCQRLVEMFLNDYNEARLVLERAIYSYITTNAKLWVDHGINSECVDMLHGIEELMLHIDDFPQDQVAQCIEAVEKNDSVVR